MTNTDRPTRQEIDKLHRDCVDAAIRLAQHDHTTLFDTSAAYAKAESEYHLAMDRYKGDR